MSSADNAGSGRRVAIIGTGFSGLCLGYHLKKRGLTDFTLFEKADAIGGTWRENTYPGAECDIPSALYSFSFERNPRWTHKWSEQPEILRYMNHCADKFGLRPHIKLGKEVTDLTFDEGKGLWHLTTADGETEEFDIVISAVGQLHKRRSKVRTASKAQCSIPRAGIMTMTLRARPFPSSAMRQAPFSSSRKSHRR